MIEKNFPLIANRMNLCNQLPAEVVVTRHPQGDRLRIVSIPQETELEVKTAKLPEQAPDILATGKLIIDEQPYNLFVRTALQKYKKYRTNSYPIDRLIMLDQIFGNAPLNRFTYAWIRSELAEILQVPDYGKMSAS